MQSYPLHGSYSTESRSSFRDVAMSQKMPEPNITRARCGELKQSAQVSSRTLRSDVDVHSRHDGADAAALRLMADWKASEVADLGAIFDAHVHHEFIDHDVDATMKTMVPEPYVHNVPTLTGGDGRAGVVDFYTNHFVGKMPADTRIERI
jgi:hypothetical protein